MVVPVPQSEYVFGIKRQVACGSAHRVHHSYGARSFHPRIALPKYPVTRLLIERSPAFGGLSETLAAESRLAVITGYRPAGFGYPQVIHR